MTREELRDYVEEQRNNIPYHVYSELIDGIDTLEDKDFIQHEKEILERIDKREREIDKYIKKLEELEQQPCKDKIIDEHYKKGFAAGIRTAEWRHNNAMKEIRENADRLKDSLYGDGLRHALEILNEYRTEGEEV